MSYVWCSVIVLCMLFNHRLIYVVKSLSYFIVLCMLLNHCLISVSLFAWSLFCSTDTLHPVIISPYQKSFQIIFHLFVDTMFQTNTVIWVRFVNIQFCSLVLMILNIRNVSLSWNPWSIFVLFLECFGPGNRPFVLNDIPAV